MEPLSVLLLCLRWRDLPSLFVLVTVVTETESDRKAKILELSPEQVVKVNVPMVAPVPVTAVYKNKLSHLYTYFHLHPVASVGQEVKENLPIDKHGKK